MKFNHKIIGFLQKLCNPFLSIVNQVVFSFFFFFFKSATRGEQIYVFFVPEALVTPHLTAMCIIAKILQEKKYQVLVLTCNNDLPWCPVLDMYGLRPPILKKEKDLICKQCSAQSRKMLVKYQLQFVGVKKYINKEIYKEYDEARNKLSGDLEDYCYNSIAFGRLATLDLSLKDKIYNFSNVKDVSRVMWSKYIETNILVYLCMKNFFIKHNVKRYIHFNDYSIFLSGQVAAQENGIQNISITQASHLNIDRRKIIAIPTVWKYISYRQMDEWPRWRSLSLPAVKVREIGDDIIVRLNSKGSHAYSPSKSDKNIFESFELVNNRKILVAYTSSLDEMIAARISLSALSLEIKQYPQPFTDQIEWLLHLTDFVENSSDLQLIVRIHPREGFNRITQNESQHLLELRENFNREFNFCHFVWPEDAISSYDLAEISDIVLTSWSTIGLELARLGCPVLTSTYGISSFPQDIFFEWGQTKEEYFAKLRTLLIKGPDIMSLVYAFRWYNLYTLGLSVDLGDLIPCNDYTELPEFIMPEKALEIEDIIVRNKDVITINHEDLIKGQSATSKSDELNEIRNQIIRFIHYLHTNKDTFKIENQFHVINESEMQRLRLYVVESKEKSISYYVINGKESCYISDGSLYIKYSPICSRLAKIYSKLQN